MLIGLQGPKLSEGMILVIMLKRKEAKFIQLFFLIKFTFFFFFVALVSVFHDCSEPPADAPEDPAHHGAQVTQRTRRTRRRRRSTRLRLRGAAVAEEEARRFIGGICEDATRVKWGNSSTII